MLTVQSVTSDKGYLRVNELQAPGGRHSHGDSDPIDNRRLDTGTGTEGAVWRLDAASKVIPGKTF